MDGVFLAERAYPYCAGIAGSLLELMESDPQTGKLKLPISSSPEIHNNAQEAWLTPNSNFDLSLLRWILSANEQMASELGRNSEAREWREGLDRMDELAVEEGVGLRLSPDESLTESHRHHSHLMAIHPLGLVNVEGGEDHLRIIEDSLNTIERLGTLAWVGYSFSWMSCIYARTGNGDRALDYLRDFITSFTLRNGFHCNGEQTQRGLSDFHYRPFTLEGNFAAGQAVHEMLLQSWGGRIRIFPAVPAEWEDVSFRDLRAEGGFIVSAQRRGAVTENVIISSTVDGPLRLVDPFSEDFESDVEVEVDGDEIRCHMGAGQSINLSRV
jgi:alpha-L-fucosidase 2